MMESLSRSDEDMEEVAWTYKERDGLPLCAHFPNPRPFRTLRFHNS
jgi:hypothetical protein